jgi:flagellar assembly factor FliW
VKVLTTRFGELRVEKEDIIQFPDGILGFEKLKKFFIVDPGDKTLILWLQSIEDPSIAFPVIEPKIFKPQYVVKSVPNELSLLQLESVDSAKVLCILTIPQDVTKMSANLKAPIIINNVIRIGKQVVLQDTKLTVRFEMYKDLKKCFMGKVSDDSHRSEYDVEKASTQKENENLKPEAGREENPMNQRKIHPEIIN